MEEIDKTTEISFHGIDYIMRCSCKDDNLTLIIEQRDNGSRWKNVFSAAYIEEITQKTGNAKKMNVFVKMLVSSLAGNSDCVFLDILTYHDLEMLKARKQKNPTSASYSTDKTKSNKRYLILTYVGEFDKVHYPLPLNFEENPDVETLKNTISRLRSEIDDLKSTKSLSQTTGEGFFSSQEQKSQDTSIQYKTENDELKKKIKVLEESLSNVSTSQTRKAGAVENDLLIKSKMDLEVELENLKKEYVKDVGKLKKRVEEAEKELEDSRTEVTRLRNELLDTDSEEFAKKAKSTKPGEEGDFSFSKKIITRHQKEIEKLTQELENMRGLDKKQKTRIRQLETELEAALKRVTYSRGSNQGTGSPYSRSRGNSPTNSATRTNVQTGGRSYSPGFQRKVETPPNRKQSPTNQRTNIFNRTPPSSKKTPETANLYGVLKQRSSNSPSLRPGLSSNTNPVVRKTTPQKQPTPTVTRGSPSSSLNRKPSPMESQARKNSPGATGGASNLGFRKQSPGKISPSSTLNKYSPKNIKPTYDYKSNTMTNTTNSRASGGVIPSKVQAKPAPTFDSDDEALKNSSTLKSSLDNSLKAGDKQSAPKLKENIQDFKDSKIMNKSQVKDLEASVDVGDIDERLNKLQDLLRMAKS